METKFDLSQFTDIIQSIEGPVSEADIDLYGRITEIETKRQMLRTVLMAFERQQDQERDIQLQYSKFLLVGMGIQALFTNVAFAFVSLGIFEAEEWVVNTFLIGTQANIFGMGLIVVRFLFSSPSRNAFLDKVMELVREQN